MKNIRKNLRYWMKNRFIRMCYFVAMIVSCDFSITYGQSVNLYHIAEQVLDSTWVEFKKELHIDPSTIFINYKGEFGLGADDEMVMQKVKNDKRGFSHYRYQQFYKGIKVLGGEYAIHSYNNVSLIGNGLIIPNLSFVVLSGIDSSAVVQTAIRKIKNTEAIKFGVSSDEINLMSDSLYPPHADLIISKLPSQSWNAGNYQLIFNVLVKIFDPSDFMYYVLIDAKTGIVLEIISGALYATGSVPTLYNGTRSLTTKWTGSLYKYRLIDESRGDGIYTRKKRPGFNIDRFVNDGNNVWDDDYKTKIHATTHWAAQMTWDYFLNTHQQNGPDNNGMGLDIITDVPIVEEDQYGTKTQVPKNQSRPATNPLEMDFSEAMSGKCNPRVSLNDVGHEFSHGTGYHAANWNATLSSSSETYALMEGFCDISGEMIENYVEGSVDWIYDDESILDNTYRRTYAPPVVDGQSALQFGDANWNSYTDGHYRGGVLRYWFYLLSVGDNGTDLFGNVFCVDGIGIDNAYFILYEALVNGFFNSSSTFATARNATITVAGNIFGQNSNEVAQVTQAWFAVGVGFAYSGTIEYNDLTVSGTQTISHNNEIAFDNLQVSSGGSLTVTSNTRIVMNATSKAASGSYFHAYIAPACAGGAKWGGNSSTSNTSYENITPDIIEQEVENEPIDINTNNNNIYLTPNPTPGRLVIIYSPEKITNSTARLEVCDVLGKTVFVKEPFAPGVANYIDLSALNQGLYLLKIISEGEVRVKKVVIE